MYNYSYCISSGLGEEILDIELCPYFHGITVSDQCTVESDDRKELAEVIFYWLHGTNIIGKVGRHCPHLQANWV